MRGVGGGGIEGVREGVERVRAVSMGRLARASAWVSKAYACVEVYAGIEGVGKCEDNA